MDYESIRRGQAIVVSLVAAPCAVAIACRPEWWPMILVAGMVGLLLGSLAFCLGYCEGERKRLNVTVNNTKQLVMPRILADQTDIADIRRQF